MTKEAHDLVKEMKTTPSAASVDQMHKMGKLMVMIAEEMDAQTQKLINLTKWIVGLTIGLGVLTVGLLVYTALLFYKESNHVHQNPPEYHQSGSENKHQSN